MTDATTGVVHEQVRVLVETQERAFKGIVYKPVKGEAFRLSDHLNTYDRSFLCLTDVQVADRGQAWRVSDKRDFIAIAISSITYVTPLRDNE
ncbi:MAG: hypothetical protein Q7W30_05180 [Coriobacteriia bacterium]|nr:hypothetical protein [Coriobacteriia bacterium]